MKIAEISMKYELDYLEFVNFLKKNGLPFKETFLGGVTIEDDVVESYISKYKECLKIEEEKVAEELAEEIARQAEEAARQAEENEIKKKAMAEMLITSGFNFDGYTIKKYSGYISGDDAMTVDRGYAWQNVSVRDGLLSSLTQIRRNALRELKEAAYELGCNAVIGVDFDYITLDPQTANLSGGTTYQPYVFCVTANGNAVIIEKDED